MPQIRLKNGLIPFEDGHICTGDGCCCEPNCIGTLPSEVVILPQGIGDYNCPVGMFPGCATHNQQKRLIYRSGSCVWTGFYGPACDPLSASEPDVWSFRVVVRSGVPYSHVELQYGGSAAYVAVWEASLETYTPVVCCETLNGLVLSFVSSTYPSCTFAGSTVRIWPECDDSPCGCVTGTEPDQLELAISGVAAGQACSNTSIINDSHFLDSHGGCIYGLGCPETSPFDCEAGTILQLGGACTYHDQVQAVIECDPYTGERGMRVVIYLYDPLWSPFGNPNVMQVAEFYAALPDGKGICCLDVDELELSLVSVYARNVAGGYDLDDDWIFDFSGAQIVVHAACP